MWKRSYWLGTIEEAWKTRPLIWLSGVRRAGKTVLSRSVPRAAYFDCELPRVRERLADAESFFASVTATRVVLDEVHRLADPTEVLKIAADHFPALRVLATGSSQLSASSRFRDRLTGRKWEIYLTPMVHRDLVDFDRGNLDHRLLRGGLPPFFLADEQPDRAFQEWMDSFWAKDIQELFRIERRASFLKFAELLLVQSGGMFEATSFAKPCEVSRTTITNYLAVLEASLFCHVVRPFSSNPGREIVAAPKVYGFDTGFVCYYRQWDRLRREDRDILWEHLVLDELMARLQARNVRYWRDKNGHEIDFVLAGRRSAPVVIECKSRAADFDPTALRHFRAMYPDGANLVAVLDLKEPYRRRIDGLEVRFETPATLADAATKALR